MKTLIAAAVAALLTTAAAAPALAADVTITLTGVEARGGQLLIALQTRGQFMQAAGSYGERIQNPAAGTTTVTFHDVAPGDYSIAVLHDEDGDEQMKMNGGMPAEGWAMLHADQLRGPPSFDEVKFTVPASGDVSETLPMIYLQ